MNGETQGYDGRFAFGLIDCFFVFSRRASLKREERKEKSVSCSKSITAERKKKITQHKGGRFALFFFTKIFEKKQKRNNKYFSLSLSFVQILSFAIKQTREEGSFPLAPFARITKRRREKEREGEREREERERESSGGGGDSLSPLSLFFFPFFFSSPNKKNKIKRSHGGQKIFCPLLLCFLFFFLSLSLSSLFPFCTKKVGAHAREEEEEEERARLYARSIDI